jgi:hypothetical protein
MPATWDEIRAFGLALPHTTESAADGFPVVKVHDRTFLRLRPDNTVAIACTPSERKALVESLDPAMATIEDSETILLKLPHAELDREVEEVITEAWRIADTQAKQADAQ